MPPLREIHNLIRALAELQRASPAARMVEGIYRDLFKDAEQTGKVDAGKIQEALFSEEAERAEREREALDEAWHTAADLVPKVLPSIVPPVGQTAEQYMMHVVRTIDAVAGHEIDVIALPRPKRRDPMGDLALILQHLETQLRLLGADGPLTGFEPAANEAAAHNSNVRHSDDFRSVVWFGKSYTFTKNQAACVKVLWEAWKAGTPELDGLTVVAQADVSQTRLIDVFRSKGKAHVAWGTMIAQGQSKGAYRLSDGGERDSCETPREAITENHTENTPVGHRRFSRAAVGSSAWKRRSPPPI